MTELYSIFQTEKTYFDRKNYGSLEEYRQALTASATVYVGNLSYFTSQDSIAELFNLAGRVKDIIMGIDDEGHPCGFCFVIYETHQEAEFAVQYVSKSRLNDRIIRVDLDAGYKKGREKGRGSGGQQRREDFRTREDVERPKKRNTYEGRDRDNRERGEKRHDRYQRTEREGAHREGAHREGSHREGGHREGGYREGGYRDGRNRRQYNETQRIDRGRKQPQKREQAEYDY